MKSFLTILFLFTCMYSVAQKRKIHVEESLICYTDKELIHPTMMLIKSGGDSIIVTKYKDEFWSTPYKGDTVYINEFELKEIIEENKNIERKKEIADSIVKRKFLIKKYGLKMGSFISNRYIKRGMTKEQAKLSWGEPNEIHRTVSASGVHEQWVYNNRQYLYFENGILTAWQD